MKIAFISLILALLPAVAMSADIPDSEKERDGILPACPGTPNCVSSLAMDPRRRVDPLPLKGSPVRSMAILEEILMSIPRTTIVSSSSERLEVEIRSLLGFVDDLVMAADPKDDVIHVRSASRSGTWDLGVNRRRVEKIRRLYMANGD